MCRVLISTYCIEALAAVAAAVAYLFLSGTFKSPALFLTRLYLRLRHLLALSPSAVKPMSSILNKIKPQKIKTRGAQGHTKKRRNREVYYRGKQNARARPTTMARARARINTRISSHAFALRCRWLISRQRFVSLLGDEAEERVLSASSSRFLSFDKQKRSSVFWRNVRPSVSVC